ncbi:disulfide bond formation protein DsbB [Ferrimonas balearica]|uniref:disulfide bond formation protein DsbB n=1 Tax=Ferrimonas balearica TaxID=44012 RepID=UPI001C98F75D|nr:disulfide bond formation protein DsbB [Ferrimonas balearica]MBY5991425.1 disulfide bond formation protein DsbB [Ferrimonas balearica]
MFATLGALPRQRAPWALLFLSAVALMVAALVFQYAMDLGPCVMCIYIRVAVCAIALGALVALLAPQNPVCQGIGWLGWLVGAGWGAKIAWQLVQKQSTPPEGFGLFGASCDFIPDFPSWLPLHHWLPSLFEPTGDCTDKAWEFLGVTMAQWTLVAFVLYLVVGLLVGAAALRTAKR